MYWPALLLVSTGIDAYYFSFCRFRGRVNVWSRDKGTQRHVTYFDSHTNTRFIPLRTNLCTSLLDTLLQQQKRYFAIVLYIIQYTE